MNTPSSNTFDIVTFGAVSGSAELATEAIRQAVRACVERGGGTVQVPPGIYLCSPFELASNVTLFLEAGAILMASSRLEDYPLETGKLSQESGRAGLVTAHGAENVSIRGRGTIDGNAMAFLYPDALHLGADNDRLFTRQNEGFNPDAQVVHGPLLFGERPGNLVRFHGCRNVLIEGVTIQNAPTWTVHFKDCESVCVHNATITSPASDWRTPNDDGIDLEACRYVRISDCDINTGDDCIAVFGSQAVAVDNCSLRSRSAGVRVNYDIGDARDLVFNNLVIDANRGVTVITRGEAVAENILFSNLVIRTRLFTGHWWGIGEPILISAIPGTNNPLPRGEAPFNQNRSALTGQIRNLRFSNISAEGEHGIVLYGCETSKLEGLHFENVRLHIRNSALHSTRGGNFDLRPSADLEHALFEHEIPAFFARQVTDLSLKGLEVSWEEGLPDYFTHALQVEEFNGLRIEGFRGRQAHLESEAAVIDLSNGSDVSLTGSRAEPGAGTFLRLNEVADQRLFEGNDLLNAQRKVYPEAHFWRG